MTEKIHINPATGQPYERRKHDIVLENKVDEMRTQVFKILGAGAIWLLLITFGVGIGLKVNDDQSQDIQDSRFDGYVQSGLAQSKRNIDTIRKIRLSNEPEESKKFRISLVNSLQPFICGNIEACEAYARTKVKK